MHIFSSFNAYKIKSSTKPRIFSREKARKNQECKIILHFIFTPSMHVELKVLWNWDLSWVKTRQQASPPPPTHTHFKQKCLRKRERKYPSCALCYNSTKQNVPNEIMVLTSSLGKTVLDYYGIGLRTVHI